MKGWAIGLVERQSALSHSGLLTRCGAVVSFSVVTGAWFYLRPAAPINPLWPCPMTVWIMILLIVCLAAMLRTDIWPLRVAFLLCLILLAELLANRDDRLESDSFLLAYGMILATSSTLVLSLRDTWPSALFTGVLCVMVLGITVVSSIVHGWGPTAALMVFAAWFIMLVVRQAAPQVLSRHWSEQAVRHDSLAAHLVAQDRRSASLQDARLLHDTVLRTLTVIGRRGAGATLEEMHAMLAGVLMDGRTSDAGTSGPAATSSDDPDVSALKQPHGTTPAVVGPGPGNDLAETLAGVACRRSRDDFTVEVFGATGPLRTAMHAALRAAAEECIVNAWRHSGTDHVDVLLSRTGSLVSVIISDAGRGFDPACVPADRLGVRESVVQRMRDAGGHAKVFSEPGRGTTVVLEAQA